MNNTVLVLGGDGFCGWPTSLFLSSKGYDVVIVDNFIRRKIDVDLGCNSLTPIRFMDERLAVWKKVTGREISFEYLNVAEDYDKFLTLLRKYRPMSIIHFAEQRSAPYSMLNSDTKRYTVNNNINATHNVLCAIVESGIDIHLVHLGSTGVYGYKTHGIAIPEGYLDVEVATESGKIKTRIAYPADPGSVYHLTKTQDALAFAYYSKNDGLRITDLHQGIVWGTQTDETILDEALVNRFDWEGLYGTALNRFIVQAMVGHPLTVYGVGGQTRAFIHIKDTVRCIELAVQHPPKNRHGVLVFNQTSECATILDLAEKISSMFDVPVRFYKNPRNEALKNDLEFVNEGFKSLGWEPITFDTNLFTEVSELAQKYKDNIDKNKIICKAVWDKSRETDYEGSETPVV